LWPYLFKHTSLEDILIMHHTIIPLWVIFLGTTLTLGAIYNYTVMLLEGVDDSRRPMGNRDDSCPPAAIIVNFDPH
jgi:hypothetical protein